MPNWKKVLVSGSAVEVRHITASGNISASGNIYAGSLQLGGGSLSTGISFGDEDTGIYEVSDDRLRVRLGGTDRFEFRGSTGTFGSPTSAGPQLTTGASSATSPGHNFTDDTNTGIGRAAADQLSLIAGGVEGIRVTTTGADFNSHITASGNISASGDIYGSDFYVSGDISSSATVIADEFKLANGAFSVDTSGDITTANDLTAGNSAANDTHQITGKTSFNGHVTSSAGSNISASATSTITAGVGAFVELHGVGTETSLEVDGPITGSAFQGTKHILVNNGFYVNDNPFIQNSLYFGGTLQHNPFNWNDPQAIGGDPMTVSSFDISDDDQNWGRILPFDVSKIEILCGLRHGLGAGDHFSLVLYTASRVEGAVTTITLTRVAQNGVTFDGAGKYTNNDLTYTGDLTAGTMIYVGVGTNTSGPDAKNARGYMSITITAK